MVPSVEPPSRMVVWSHHSFFIWGMIVFMPSISFHVATMRVTFNVCSFFPIRGLLVYLLAKSQRSEPTDRKSLTATRSNQVIKTQQYCTRRADQTALRPTCFIEQQGAATAEYLVK